MPTFLRSSILGAVAVLGIALLAVPASAAVAPALHVTMTPGSGPAGTSVDFTPVVEEECPTSPAYSSLTASLATSAGAPSTDWLASSLADGAGAWELSYTIPADAPVGDLTFYVECHADIVVVGGGDAPAAAVTVASYVPVTFSVTPPATTTTTSTTTTSTTIATTTTTTTTTTATGAITLNPTFMFPGETCQWKGTGFAPGAEVTVTVFSDPLNLGTAVADQVGAVAGSWTVPASFPAGNHTIVLKGAGVGGEVQTLTGAFVVGSRVSVQSTAAPTTAVVVTQSTGTLPATGTDAGTLALAGGVLVVGGATAVVATRRRRSPR